MANPFSSLKPPLTHIRFGLSALSRNTQRPRNSCASTSLGNKANAIMANAARMIGFMALPSGWNAGGAWCSARLASGPRARETCPVRPARTARRYDGTRAAPIQARTAPRFARAPSAPPPRAARFARPCGPSGAPRITRRIGRGGLRRGLRACARRVLALACSARECAAPSGASAKPRAPEESAEERALRRARKCPCIKEFAPLHSPNRRRDPAP